MLMNEKFVLRMIWTVRTPRAIWWLHLTCCYEEWLLLHHPFFSSNRWTNWRVSGNIYHVFCLLLLRLRSPFIMRSWWLTLLRPLTGDFLAIAICTFFEVAVAELLNFFFLGKRHWIFSVFLYFILHRWIFEIIVRIIVFGCSNMMCPDLACA